MTHDADQLALLARIDDVQAALREKLRPLKSARLYHRPPSGEWSPIENVRHLVFAEQHHFRTHLPLGFRWSEVGVPPPNRKGERRLSPVGSDPATPVDDVFDAWAKVHQAVREFAIEEPGQLTWRLEGNLKHIAIHAATIERLLRE